MDKKPVKITTKIRPPSAIDRLTAQVRTTPSTLHLSVPPDNLVINEDNVRNTFKSLNELSDFMDQIGWPHDGLSGGLENPIDWLEQLDSDVDAKRLKRFIRIVQLALSIDSDGQLQAVGGIPQGDSYRIVLGSTRVMACFLLRRNVEIRTMTDEGALSELQAHLSENLQRDNLTFAETANGYVRLFRVLLESGAVERISRSVVMKYLNLPRTPALRWKSVLNQALTDEKYREMILSGSVTSITEAYATLTPSPLPNSEARQNGCKNKNYLNMPSTTVPLQPQHTTDVRHITGVDKKFAPPSERDINTRVDVANRMILTLFRSEVEYQSRYDISIAERISAYINTNMLSISSSSEAGKHFDWLLNEVTTSPSK